MPRPPSGSNLLLSENFVSIQGEGVSLGSPAAFVRLGGCNLACNYCDTAYTWDDSRYDLERELTSVAPSEVESFLVEGAPGRVIFTGGEPLIQQSKMVALLQRVDASFEQRSRQLLVVEVETNGTIEPCQELLSRVDQWNVSPKLHCSGESVERRRRLKALRAFADERRAFFKFVVSGPEDLEEVESLQELLNLDSQRVLLMPEAATPEVLAERSPQVAAWALDKGLRFTTRLHLQLYGGRRGT